MPAAGAARGALSPVANATGLSRFSATAIRGSQFGARHPYLAGAATLPHTVTGLGFNFVTGMTGAEAAELTVKGEIRSFGDLPKPFINTGENLHALSQLPGHIYRTQTRAPQAMEVNGGNQAIYHLDGRVYGFSDAKFTYPVTIINREGKPEEVRDDVKIGIVSVFKAPGNEIVIKGQSISGNNIGEQFLIKINKHGEISEITNNMAAGFKHDIDESGADKLMLVGNRVRLWE